VQEVLNDFLLKVSDAGRTTSNARTGAYDDLVLRSRARCGGRRQGL